MHSDPNKNKNYFENFRHILKISYKTENEVKQDAKQIWIHYVLSLTQIELIIENQ